MTINTTANRKEYTGNGVTTAFSFPYYFLADADLVVIETVIATGVQTTKTLTTHYTVTGAGDQAGGTVTMLVAPASTVTLTIYRDPSAIQDVDLVEGDPLPVETAVEQPLDKLTMIAQRVKELIGRALRLPEGDTGFVDADLYLPAEVDRASKYLGFDADGKPVATAGTTSVPLVSAFAETLLDDASAADARTTLGLGTAAVIADNTLVHLAGAEQITGAKDIVDDSTFYDAASPTKKIQFDASGVTAGQTRVITPPDVNVTLPYKPGTYGAMQVYTSSDTWTKPSGLKRVKVTVVAGGGGGGGSAQATNAAGGGGGAGSTGIKTIEAASLGDTETVTVGDGGAGGTAGNNAGSTGGTSSFGAHVSCTGGLGGTGSGTGAGSNGGTASDGDINIAGGYGDNGNGTFSGTAGAGGNGGSSHFGSGGRGGISSEAGLAALSYGAGGGGAADNNTGARAGGAGKAGIVFVEEFF